MANLQRKQSSSSLSTKSSLRTVLVDVVITCHNYSRFLEECLISVWAQGVDVVGECIVVDDSSDDHPELIVEKFGGVSYIRIEARDVCTARNTGLQQCENPFVLFLDADNKLAPNYLRAASKILQEDPHVGIVSCDLQLFGEDNKFISLTDKFSNQNITCFNSLDTGCVARRTALLQAVAIQPHTGRGLLTAEDWVMWRRLLDSGNWTVKPNPIPLLYRKHGECLSSSRLSRVHQSSRPWYEDAGIAHEVVTIFTTISKRVVDHPELWQRRIEWLKQQEWSHAQTRLLIANTSHRPLSTNDLRIEELNTFAGVSLYNHYVGRPGLEDINRRNEPIEKEVQHTVAAIYNRMLREVTTNYVLILEDDVFPTGLDTIERLLSHFDSTTYAVAGTYKQRYTNAWSTYDRDRLLSPSHLHKETGSGVQIVGGAGMGCLLLKTSLCVGDVFVACEEPSRYFDVHWYWTKLQERPDLVCKVDWDLYCDHVGEKFYT